VQHAIRELEFAGVEHDVRPSIIAAVKAFASYGHSGGSASAVIPMLNDLLNFRNIGPLTSHPDEWQHIEENIAGDNLTWQSRRHSDAFSKNNGITYYVLSEERRWVHRMLAKIPKRLRVKIPTNLWLRLIFPFHKSVMP
jgi:hypothetical protein